MASDRATTKLDLRKVLKTLYSPRPNTVAIVDVPPLNFLMIDGRGNPNTAPVYQEAVEALYGLAYGLKFHTKRSQGMDFAVMPLEGLWWVEGAPEFELRELMARKDEWQWTMMIAQPEIVTAEMLDSVRSETARKRNLAGLDRIRYTSFHEGQAVQTLHIGPYAAETPTIERLHEFIRANGFQFYGRHHEIYLSDPRRSAPEKLKTILRQPVRMAAT
jgi:hypothetical protein